MTWWQALLVALVTVWCGVAWMEHVIEDIVSRRLEVQLMRIEQLLIQKRIIDSDDDPWPDYPNNDDEPA